MKKSTIWLLTAIMAITFAGLLYIQIMYVKNIVTIRNEQFAESVRRSLYAVSSELERSETRRFLEEDVAGIRSSVLPTYTPASGDLEGLKYSFTSSTGVRGDFTLKGTLPSTSGNLLSPNGTLSDKTTSVNDVIREQYLYQRGLMNEVIVKIISQASNRPIEQRADSSTVSRILHTEFVNNGLDLPFEFAVMSRMGSVVYKTAGYKNGPDNSVFMQTLFPNDSQSRMNYLKVYFPDKRDYIYHSIKFLFPSFVFTLILLVVFLYTIIVAFRQKKLTEMKNDFINNMTHEFKTPISTISLAAQMLNDNSVRKSPKMLEHISTVINDETKRLRFQVEKVLQMSMFERQSTTLNLRELDANPVIANIVSTFKIKVEKYGGSIDCNLEAENSTVEVDEMHFTNVIFNLLDNAVKYRREEEPLTLTISTRDVGDNLEIAIADNGIGIRKDDLKKIFDRFYRVSTGNLHDVKGFGLGLAYVRKMVGELHGSITVESDLGRGTKFILLLPLIKN